MVCASNLLERARNYVVNKKLGFRSYSVETSDGSFVSNRVHVRKSNEDPPDTPFLPTTRTVEPSMKTTSPSTTLHSTELERCIPAHSTPQHEAQSLCVSEIIIHALTLDTQHALVDK